MSQPCSCVRQLVNTPEVFERFPMLKNHGGMKIILSVQQRLTYQERFDLLAARCVSLEQSLALSLVETCKPLPICLMGYYTGNQQASWSAFARKLPRGVWGR